DARMVLARSILLVMAAVIAVTWATAAVGQPPAAHRADGFPLIATAQEEPAKKPPGKKAPPEAGAEGKDQEKDAGKEEQKDKEKDKDEAKDKDKEKEKKPAWYSAHGQGTVVGQGNWKFRSPYIGLNSLLPILNYRTTETATLYLAARLWEGGVVVFNPEIA